MVLSVLFVQLAENICEVARVFNYISDNVLSTLEILIASSSGENKKGYLFQVVLCFSTFPFIFFPVNNNFNIVLNLQPS